MSDEKLTEAVRAALAAVAPESRQREIAPDVDLREELDLDSMDFLRFCVGLHDGLGVEVPEADYPRLFTLEGAVEYLRERVEP